MVNNSTPVNTPESGTVNTAELIMSEDFMKEVMGDMAPGEKQELPPIPTHDEVEAQQRAEQGQVNNHVIEQKQTTEKEVEQTEQSQEIKEDAENTKNSVSQKEDVDVLEKRWKDAQTMIGRQSNELGQLRKQVSEFQASMESAKKNNEGQNTPYYEKLLTNNPDVLAQQLNISREQVEMLQLAARIAKDISKDEAKPLQQAANEIAQQKEIQAKDASWYADHPEYKTRQPVMAKFLNKLYPNGPVAHGVDPWQAAHMAYEHAGEVMATVQKDVTNQNDKRIVNARSANGSTQSVDASAALKQQQKPMDAKTAEIDKIFQAQAGQLMRAAR